jgi:hypothetical protein
MHVHSEMDVILTPQQKFKENFNDFFKAIVEIIEDVTVEDREHFAKATVVDSLRELIGIYDNEVIMSLFINQTHIHWTKIKERDASFFTHLQRMLAQLPLPAKDPNDNTFMNIMTLTIDGRQVVKQNKRDLLWDYIESFVCILIAFVHETRLPKTKILPNGTKKPIYLRSFIPTFSVLLYAKAWSIDLTF